MVHRHPAAARCSKRLPAATGLPLQSAVTKWVLSPGNYQRWRLDRKAKVALELLEELEAAGYQGFASVDVDHAIQCIERQYVNLAQWMQKSEIRASDLLRGEVDGKVRTKAERIFPSYCDLLPVFPEFTFPVEASPSSYSSPSSSSSAGKDNEDEVEGDEQDEDVAEYAGTTAGRKRPIEVAFRSSKAQRPLSSGVKSLTKRESTLYRPHGLAGVFSPVAACKLDYEMKTIHDRYESEQTKRLCAAQGERFRADGEKWKSEVERYKAEAAKAQMQAERARAATEQRKSEIEQDRCGMAFKVEGLASRHELAEKGVPFEEIDKIIPL